MVDGTNRNNQGTNFEDLCMMFVYVYVLLYICVSLWIDFVDLN